MLPALHSGQKTQAGATWTSGLKTAASRTAFRVCSKTLITTLADLLQPRQTGIVFEERQRCSSLLDIPGSGGGACPYFRHRSSQVELWLPEPQPFAPPTNPGLGKCGR